MSLEGVSEAMSTANSVHQAAYRYDRKHGTSTLAELPEDVLTLAREYKRLQMQSYRRRDGMQPVGSHLLKEDGIVDPIAVEVAASGSRLVYLTQRERVLAVWIMEHRGLTQREMERRLQLSDYTVYYLRQEAKRVPEMEFRELTAA